MAKTKKQDYLYLKIRVTLNKKLSEGEIDNLVNELDYNITSQTKGVKVIDTHLEESSRTWNFADDDDNF